MKIIHCADIHLGSKIESKLPKNKADIRKKEVRLAFSDMVEYAQKENVKIILISGDLFDSDRPLKKDKDFFYSIVKSYPNIDFIYLRGNHDKNESYEEYSLENLKMFDKKWKTYDYGKIKITGVELIPENEKSIYSNIKLEDSATNIVMLHGYENLNLINLKNKNIDYLALGHLHAYKKELLDERGEYVYSGCLEGRGFDEIGTKGFVLLNIDQNGKIQSKFVPNSKRVIEEIVVDATNIESSFELFKNIKETVNFINKNLYLIKVIGSIKFDNDNLKQDMEKYLENECFYVSIKDKTRRILNIEEIKKELSLSGEFVRTVLGNSELTEDVKYSIIELGLKALNGQEVEI